MCPENSVFCEIVWKKSKFFVKLLKKSKFFRNFLWKIKIFCEIAWKKSKFVGNLPWKIDFFGWNCLKKSEMFLENRFFFTQLQDPQISNQIDATVLRYDLPALIHTPIISGALPLLFTLNRSLRTFSGGGGGFGNQDKDLRLMVHLVMPPLFENVPIDRKGCYNCDSIQQMDDHFFLKHHNCTLRFEPHK